MNTEKSKGKIDRKIENTTTKKESVNEKQNQKEKKMSTAQKALPVLIVVSISLVIILMATLIAFFQLKKDDDQNSRTLEAVYASSYFSMVDGINNLQVDSSKFQTLQNQTAQRKSLKDMEQDCQVIISGLSILPMEAQNSMSAMKFFNQIDGMCEAYINTLDRDEALSTEEIALVGEMSYVLGTIKEQFNTHNSMVNKVGYSFIDASVFNNKGVNEFSNTLGSLKNETIEYPTMIFDGPFSASLEDKEIRGLGKKEISRADAEEYIKNKVFYGQENVKLKYLGETNGDFVTYDFDCEIDNTKHTIQVTKREGKLLTLSGFAEDREPIMSKDEAIKYAEVFATRLGFENMKSVWWEISGNIAYINLAPITDSIIMYPDLIKVKLDIAGQKILGFEAQNYCFNHIDRNANKTVSEGEAKAIIDGDYQIINIDLAIIPLSNGKEILTYELKCEGIDGLYYFYVDAINGTVAETLKVVDQKGLNKLI